MSPVVWLAANTLTWPEGGGHLWPYLNWALGLRALGCRVIWLETVDPQTPSGEARTLVHALERKLERYGLNDSLALCTRTAEPLPSDVAQLCIDIDAASDADLLLNMAYGHSRQALPRFRRTAVLDIDPGLTQVWISEGVLPLPPHDVYFTLGETVGQSTGKFPSADLPWEYTPPCVALDWWPVRQAVSDAPFTTVSSWDNNEWVTHGGASYDNSKRAGFLPFLELPRHTTQRMELALCLLLNADLRLAPHQQQERTRIERMGWQVRHSYEVASTPWDYQRYIQGSLGEFSCAKPSCMRLQNAWMSDRTVCYLATGKPAVVQHTGPTRFLPDEAGLFRFTDLAEAARSLETVAGDYEKHCRLARALAEEHFDARTVASRLLERALP